MSNSAKPDELSPAPERPTENDLTVRLAAARELAARMSEWGWLHAGDNVDDAANDIEKCSRHETDGYRIARDLESRCYWFCNFEIAEALEGFFDIISQHNASAQKKWAAEYNVTPPFPIGTRVTFAKGEVGIIVAILKNGAAKYAIAVDNDPDAATPKHSRRIVNFEDVRPAPS